MDKHTLASAISLASAAICQPVFAASMTCSVGGGTNNGLVYTTTATSAGIAVASAVSTPVYYVDDTLPSASDPNNPGPSTSFTLVVGGDWCIDTTTGAFTGNIAYGNYKVQVNAPNFLGARHGRITFAGVNQAFSGTGTWGTNGSGLPTLSYSYMNPTSGAGGGSVQTQTSASCADSGTGIPRVCNVYASLTQNWEGLNFTFTFDAIKYAFTGPLTGFDTSGTALSRTTVAINWNIAGVDPPAVPIPATAWLFGSALLGLGAITRQRHRRHLLMNGITSSNP